MPGYVFQFRLVFQEFPSLLEGALLTIHLSFLTLLLSLIVGTAGAMCRLSRIAWLRRPATWYVEVVRNTPLLVQLFFIYFGLPGIGVRLSNETASVLAMVINLGAYAAEIVRAGIATTPRGQIEAAQSLALSELQVFTRVVLPPSLQRVWPALVSQIIIVMLGSAVCGQISTNELSYAVNLIHSRNFRAFEATFVGTGIYLVMAIALRHLLNWAGPRFVFGK